LYPINVPSRASGDGIQDERKRTMDVSNSTGESTGYRVLGSGGATPEPAKVRQDETLIVIKGKKFARVGNRWHEVLAEGTLEPYTYVTVKSRKQPCLVEFFRGSGLASRCDVPVETRSTAVTAKPAPAGYLVALMPNGKSAKTCVCRWKKV
jgi:hypothetical protein